ncbi:hypothetical protein [Candidatus Anaplasma sp. TIGMIC]|uniref:hypothetical protein n=1 Tax=Candidatus Anaplasma sp. TIGMIC TaxID=3020713 RepID=UPI00232FACF5|nr:hypothetical protein [Candidatus Anaplasma sp. TIGMIC]MDB1135699.1 hypothetical protein [Candidatus Anaplasma sp. TIGMIC]
MGYESDADSVIESTLDRLDETRAYAESFRGDVMAAFRSGAITETQFKKMRDYVEGFLSKISLYESVFERIKDAYGEVK